MKLALLFLFVLTLSSCAEMNSQSTTSNTFSTQNVMKVHIGMSSKEIIDLFGEPKSISQSICGASTGHPWSCINWEYGKYPDDRATFTFDATNPDKVILNNFKIDRK